MGVVLVFPRLGIGSAGGVDVVPVSMKRANRQTDFYWCKKKTGPPAFVLPGLRGSILPGGMPL